MQDWANVIREFALLISSFTAGVTAWNALKKLKHDTSKENKEELREDVEIYRKRWLESEKGYNELDAENEKLKRKIKRLETRLKNGK